MTIRISRRSRTAAALIAVALIWILGAAGPASAHTDLIGSTPASMARVATPPERVVLRFSEAVDPQLATVVLTAHDLESQRVPTRIGNGPGVLLAEVPAAMVDTGPWRVDYRVTSVDGHPIQGRLEFVVENMAPGSSGETQGSDSSPDQSESERRADAESVAPSQDTSPPVTGEDAPEWLVLLVAVVMLSPVVAILTWSLWRHRKTARTGHGGV